MFTYFPGRNEKSRLSSSRDSSKAFERELAQKHIRSITTGRKTADSLGDNEGITPIETGVIAGIHDVFRILLHTGE